MRIATCALQSTAPYSQSRAFQTPKNRDQTHDEYEMQTWRERCHVNDDKVVQIPPMAFKCCLSEAAKYKSVQIPGRGKATYTKHFEAGVLCVKPVSLGITIDEVVAERVFVPADGRRGGTKRVYKMFPVFSSWSGNVEFLVLDELIDEEVFETHLRDAGAFIGIGRFRPRNNGFYGRFEVNEIKWTSR